jgi:anti-sigma regulatory factor (Ser/Thr protein kinase)
MAPVPHGSCLQGLSTMTGEASGSGPDKTFDFRVEGGIGAAAAARRAIRAGNGTLSEGVREDVLLLVTELVTNAVRHGEVVPPRSVHVAVHEWLERVRVEVVDAGPGFEPTVPGPGGPSGGWGLYVVERVADRWGVTPAVSGSCVWFEIESQGGDDEAAA